MVISYSNRNLFIRFQNREAVEMEVESSEEEEEGEDEIEEDLESTAPQPGDVIQVQVSNLESTVPQPGDVIQIQVTVVPLLVATLNRGHPL